MARAGTPTTQSGLWGGYELLERDSVLINGLGTTDILDRELAEALQTHLGITSPQAMRHFLGELLPDLGITDMGDLGGYDLTEILEGIF